MEEEVERIEVDVEGWKEEVERRIMEGRIEEAREKGWEVIKREVGGGGGGGGGYEKVKEEVGKRSKSRFMKRFVET